VKAPSGHTAVRAQKRPRGQRDAALPWQTHELFPTPPWATRALFENVFPAMGLPAVDRSRAIWEPCAGLRHMADVCEEYARVVIASDVCVYDETLDVRMFDFVGGPVQQAPGIDAGWIITNPPFGLAADIFERARCLLSGEPHGGIALLLRLSWLEGADRFERIFSRAPPTVFAPFAERVPMCEGGYDPAGSTATAYAWFVWRIEDGLVARTPNSLPFFPTFVIPPGRREALTRASDRRLAALHVPGWVAPSTLKASGKDQDWLDLVGGKLS